MGLPPENSSRNEHSFFAVGRDGDSWFYVKLIERKNSDRSCRSVGSYSFTNHDSSVKLLDSRIANAMATKADIIAAANPLCLLQLRLGVERTKMDAKVIQIAELLDWVY